MSPVPSGTAPEDARHRRDAVFVAGMVAVFLVCVVRNPSSDTHPFRSFDPLPDAIEYAVGAANLNAGRGLTLGIDGHFIPSRFPIGFPLLIALCYRLLGDDVANAYWVSVALAAATIPLVYWTAMLVAGDRRAARWSAFLFATGSLTLSFAPLVMSETCSAFLTVLALGLTLRCGRTSGAAAAAALGLVLGFGLLVRTANLIVLAPIGLHLVRTVGRRWGIRRWLALLAPIAAVAAALLVFDARVFGSPWRSGYALYTPRVLFAPRFFAANAGAYFRTLALAVGGKALWLDGPFYGPLLPLLASVGVAVLWRAGERPLVGLFGSWLAVFYLFYASYFYYDFRFFTPVMPLVTILAAVGLAAALAPLPARPRAALAAIAIALHLLQPFSVGTSPLAAAWRNRLARRAPANYQHVQAVNAYMTAIGATAATHVVVSPLNLVYFDHYSNQRYALAPLSHDQEYARVPEVATALGWQDVTTLLAGGRQVYVSDFGLDDDTRPALRALAEHARLEPVAIAGGWLLRVTAAPRSGARH